MATLSTWASATQPATAAHPRGPINSVPQGAEKSTWQRREARGIPTLQRRKNQGRGSHAVSRGR